MNRKMTTGMRFKMRFEGDEAPDRRVSGTIVGVTEKASSQWEDSEWRSLKVQWDEPSTVTLPNRVCPWELEPLVAPTPTSQPIQRIKRPRPPCSPVISPDLSSASGAWKSPSQTTQMFSFSGSQRVPEHITPPKPLSVLSAASNACSIEFATKISPPPVADCQVGWPVTPETQNEALSVSINKESCDKRHEASKGCRLFGIQLTEGRRPVQETLSVPTIRGIGVDRPVPSLEVDSEQQSQPTATNEAEKSCLRLSRERRNQQLRSCTKVHMQGMAVGRAVDLTRLCGYLELLQKLEDMFNIKEELTTALTKWVVLYTDDENMMTVGNDPWPEFCRMVRKMYIYTHEEAKQRLSPKRKHPVLAVVKHASLLGTDTDADQNYLADEGADEGNAGVAA